ncbi:MAG: non-canonical purine NTP pyrophosphatase [Bacteroidota bacterium]|nr:MAG: non-canonical purine NTP pyrophosphatase [Bacteroidota bacterium]
MHLIFATHNENKVVELRRIIPKSVVLWSLNDINYLNPIEETGKTLEENAKIKSDFIRKKFGLNCFADDSGLEIDFLKGEPGVLSARYAGPSKNIDMNIQKIWKKLENVSNPTATFRSIFYLHLNNQTFCFEGKVYGKIIFEKRGNNGFGYDPIFIPKGYNKTFAELGNDIKDQISHRAKATLKLINFISRVS